MENKITFFTDGINAPIFKIHSYPLLLALKMHFDISILSFEENKKMELNQELFLNQKKKITKFFYLKLIFNYRIFFLPKIINQIIILLPQVYYFIIRSNIKYFHARGYVPAIILHYLKYILNIKYIFDMRGVLVDELKVSNSLTENNIKVRIWRHLEKKAIESSSSIVVVSLKFYEYIRLNYPEKDVNVIKNSIVQNKISENEYYKYRNKFRKKINVQDKIVWVYSGSSYKWQLIPKMVEYFETIVNKYNNHFFYLARDNIKEISEMFESKNIPKNSYLIKSVKAEHVKYYLFASDLGILLREQNIINQVSHPLKFVEYLYAGLVILITKGIGDTEDLVQRNKIGVILKNFSINEFEAKYDKILNLLKHHNPLNTIDIANKDYSFSDSVNNYNLIYSNLIN